MGDDDTDTGTNTTSTTYSTTNTTSTSTTGKRYGPPAVDLRITMYDQEGDRTTTLEAVGTSQMIQERSFSTLELSVTERMDTAISASEMGLTPFASVESPVTSLPGTSAESQVVMRWSLLSM